MIETKEHVETIDRAEASDSASKVEVPKPELADPIDALAQLDFSMPEITLEQEALPDVELETTALAEIPQQPTYDEGTQIEIGAGKQVHKRSGPKIMIALGFSIVAASMLSSLGGGVITGGASTAEDEETVKASDESEPNNDADQQRIGELETKLATNELSQQMKDREEQRKQQLAAEKQAQKDARNPFKKTPQATTQARTTPVRIPAPRYQSSFRQPPSTPKPPPSRTVAARIPVTQVPQSRPAPVSLVRPSVPEEPPTLVSFGSMPETESFDSEESGQYNAQAVSYGQKPSDPVPFGDDQVLLAQQQQSFLSGQKQTRINSGQTISAVILGQVLAQPESVFHIRTTQDALGLPANSELKAVITGVSGKYVSANVFALLHPNGSESAIPENAIAISKQNGKLLKAKSNKGFFQSTAGQALLGFGRSAADQFTSRSESFTSNQFGSSFSRGAGKTDLTSLAGAGIKGFSEPFLNRSQQSENALTLNPGTSIRLNVNSSFVISRG